MSKSFALFALFALFAVQLLLIKMIQTTTFGAVHMAVAFTIA
ncbi:hypothetical protein [Thiorhodococcus minor]